MLLEKCRYYSTWDKFMFIVLNFIFWFQWILAILATITFYMICRNDEKQAVVWLGIVVCWIIFLFIHFKKSKIDEILQEVGIFHKISIVLGWLATYITILPLLFYGISHDYNVFRHCGHTIVLAMFPLMYIDSLTYDKYTESKKQKLVFFMAFLNVFFIILTIYAFIDKNETFMDYLLHFSFPTW